MSREIINENNAAEVTGGSIVFNAEHTTCGRNCNNQYGVADYSSVMQYIADNRFDMSERTMLDNMLSLGYIYYL